MIIHPLTRYIVESGALENSVCTVVDVGASGGLDRKWFDLAPHLRGFGFDLLVSEVDALNNRIDSQLNVSFHACAIGTGKYGLTPGTASNRVGPERLAHNPDQELITYNFSTTDLVETEKAMSLDEFFKDEKGSLDFIKIDTDGADFDVLMSGERVLDDNRVLGLEVECQFHGEMGSQSGVFANIDTFLRERGFSLFDLDLVRTSRKALPGKAVSHTISASDRGQVIWANAIYFRDLGNADYQNHWSFSMDTISILKLACLFELHNLRDCAAELILKHTSVLEGCIDTTKALDCLTREYYGELETYAGHMDAFENDRGYFIPGMHGLMEQYGITYREFVELMEKLKGMRTRLDQTDFSDKTVAFYGAGGRFTSLYPGMKAHLVHAAGVLLCDSNASLHGTDVAGITVISPKQMAQAEPDVVLVTSVYYKEIVLGLWQLGKKHSVEFDIKLLD